jgi:hypothetical protein
MPSDRPQRTWLRRCPLFHVGSSLLTIACICLSAWPRRYVVQHVKARDFTEVFCAEALEVCRTGRKFHSVKWLRDSCAIIRLESNSYSHLRFQITFSPSRSIKNKPNVTRSVGLWHFLGKRWFPRSPPKVCVQCPSDDQRVSRNYNMVVT